MRIPDRVKKLLWSSATFLLPLILGGGGVWSYFQWKVESARASYEALQTRATVSEELNNILVRAVSLQKEYQEVIRELRKYFPPGPKKPQDPGWNEVPQLRRRSYELKKQLELANSELQILESRLAPMEGRKPRDIALDITPPAGPTNIHFGPVSAPQGTKRPKMDPTPSR